jgi:hypothetical protein
MPSHLPPSDWSVCAWRIPRAKRTSRPLLLLPSPDTSIVRRSAPKGARANWAKAKSMPPLMDVLSAKERGISSNWSTNGLPLPACSIGVQSITRRCEPGPDHSMKQTAIRPCPPSGSTPHDDDARATKLQNCSALSLDPDRPPGRSQQHRFHAHSRSSIFANAVFG